MRKSSRWTRKPSDFSHVRTGNKVAVQMGAGFTNGVMVNRFKDHVLVQLTGTKRTIAVWDARNIR